MTDRELERLARLEQRAEDLEGQMDRRFRDLAEDMRALAPLVVGHAELRGLLQQLQERLEAEKRGLFDRIEQVRSDCLDLKSAAEKRAERELMSRGWRLTIGGGLAAATLSPIITLVVTRLWGA